MSCSSDENTLAGSPDRIVDDNTVLEIKCLYVYSEKSICPQTVPYLINNDDTLTLDPNKNYNYASV